MFIPPGETIHESLATSYVLVDALVADLCEGGFSGFVEVVLRDTNSFIVISSGEVAAAVEMRESEAGAGATTAHTRTTVEQLAARSRRERGHISVQSYSPATAAAVAGRLNAQPLYVGLSTEFTDLEKMISKLLREPDREWFIEVGGDGPAALIHVHDAVCRIINSTSVATSGALDLARNPALSRLIDECNQAGGAFDVFFRLGAETTDGSVQGLTSPNPSGPLAQAAAPAATGDLIEPRAGDLWLLWDELPPAAEAEAMPEIKRLMSEIARAIEEAAQAVGRPDSFSMSLRAAQLKIADRFPFLDPFAGDFEYLAGEIVFVGHAPSEEFVAGLTEAFKLAIEGVTHTTAHAARFRSYVAEDLQKLIARERDEFEKRGLDQVIQQLVTF